MVGGDDINNDDEKQEENYASKALPFAPQRRPVTQGSHTRGAFSMGPRNTVAMNMMMSS